MFGKPSFRFVKNAKLNEATHFRIQNGSTFVEYYKVKNITIYFLNNTGHWELCPKQDVKEWLKEIKPITYEVTTENDVEGRSIKSIGRFTGSKEQIIQYMFENEIPYTYNLYFQQLIIEDVSNYTCITHTVKDCGNYEPIKQDEEMKKKINKILLSLDKETLLALNEANKNDIRYM